MHRIYFYPLLFLFFLAFLTCVPAYAALAAAPDDKTTGEATTLFNPLGQTANDADVSLVIGRIIRGALGFTGVLALALFIWGGFQIFISRGSKDMIEKGKKTIVFAVIGLAIIFASYSLVAFVFKIMQSST